MPHTDGAAVPPGHLQVDQVPRHATNWLLPPGPFLRIRPRRAARLRPTHQRKRSKNEREDLLRRQIRTSQVNFDTTLTLIRIQFWAYRRYVWKTRVTLTIISMPWNFKKTVKSAIKCGSPYFRAKIALTGQFLGSKNIFSSKNRFNFKNLTIRHVIWIYSFWQLFFAAWGLHKKLKTASFRLNV